MPDENNYGGVPVLDDIDYTPTARKEGPQGVSAPVLDDIEYVDSVQKRGAPKGVSAPVLETMDTYNPAFEQSRGEPTGVSG
ncbi:MAG: ABC transporter permease, partial [Ruminococcus sp.]|nr:ABC transporter permease [Ruminococcus sp.]